MKRVASPPRVAILGCGPVGRALAIELLESSPAAIRGPLAIWSRTRGSREALRRRARALHARNGRRLKILAKPGEALDEADVVVLCVADGALAAMAGALAQGKEALVDKPALRDKVVLFTNGYHPLDCLAPLRRLGCAVGRLHPLAPVPAEDVHAALRMVPFGIEGDARALGVAKRLVRAIQGQPLLLRRRRGAPAYHAGASLFCGGLVALFHLAEQVMTDAVDSPVQLRKALEVFAVRTLRNAGRLGPMDALTGALARGSEPIVRGHLAALGRVPAARELYCRLGEVMLHLARARGSIPSGKARRVQAVLRQLGRAEGVRRRERGTGSC